MIVIRLGMAGRTRGYMLNGEWHHLVQGRARTFVTPANGSGFDSINFTILQGEDNESYLRLEGPEYASTTTGCSDVVCSAKCKGTYS